ncbi:crossover junction endonuclease MUS81-like isoform X2 [Chenopodium quinoa]|uniref:crossover junction endonuclease MUS81-like isoform X2 n=1 Tax=Chenopodium quinoa TaxID=63459 RepID=UPI000B7932CC|nr:crossover junction endonuclease MUS81-like isoform X2 [Chenopodium quinoa]
MAIEKRPVCEENDELVAYMRKCRTERMEKNPQAHTQNIEKTVKKALTNVCDHKTPITTLKEFQAIKGIGKWLANEMREFFNSNSSASQDDNLAKGGKKAKGSRRYLPQKNSVAYALLISLHRATTNGKEFMHKQELIDAAEASGLSRVPIAPEAGRGKQKQFGSSPRDWYSGWSAMTTLIGKDLVYKNSNPAKYMLSDEGRKVAIECLSRSGMLDSAANVINTKEALISDDEDAEIMELEAASSPSSPDLNKGMKDDIPLEFLDRFTALGYTSEQVLHTLAEVSVSPPTQELSTLWPTVLCHLRENEVYGLPSDPQPTGRKNSDDASTSCRYVEGEHNVTGVINQNGLTSSSTLDYHGKKASQSSYQASPVDLRLPPLEDLQKFEDTYEIVLILDDREHFARTKSRNLKEKICEEYKIQIEVRRLPVGDAIWIARHKKDSTEYVLDFIVERKNVDDLRSSIRDNRYRDQKLRLQRTGMKKIMYLVEGDPNACEGADSIKTACFTTEILEGFDVQRTTSLVDTLHRYGFLTLAITDHYKLISSAEECKTAGVCPKYKQFIKKCEDADKLTVSDVFATQLMQVSQVTEDVAMAVLECYPTLYSLAHAYAALDKDTLAQQELLMKKSEGAVNAVASRNIYRFVWAD